MHAKINGERNPISVKIVSDKTRVIPQNTVSSKLVELLNFYINHEY